MATKSRILTSLFTKQDSLIFISMLQLFSPIFTILKDRLHNSYQLGISPFDWTSSLNLQTVGTGGHVPKWQKKLEIIHFFVLGVQRCQKSESDWLSQYQSVRKWERQFKKISTISTYTGGTVRAKPLSAKNTT